MAAAQLITHTDLALLKVSTQSRSGTPDGNIYFDMANNLVEIITAEELANVDFGGGSEANPLTNALGITMRALYNFENASRVDDESLRTFLRATLGTYTPAGAFALWNGNKFATAGSTAGSDDRNKIRGSGFVEYSDDGKTIDRIYHGIKSLNAIQPTTQPIVALVANTVEATLQAATWTNTFRTGDIDEMVQVFGTTANGDATAGDFDDRTKTLVVRPRSWGYNSIETTSILAGITELSGLSAGYGTGEAVNTQNTFDLADVFGGSQIAPWTGMSLEKLAVAQVETGFNEADGNFTWVLHNTLGGTVQECAAYLDALSLQNADIDSGAGSYIGLNGRLWYDFTTLVVTRSIESEGLFIEGLPLAEQQNLVQTDDAGNTKTYPFFPSVVITVGATAVADARAFYQVFYLDGAALADFDTAAAVTVDDSSGNPIKGNVTTDAVANKISFAYSYDTNTQAGLAANIDKDMVVVVEGDGGAAQAITEFTVTRTATIPVTCAPNVDSNA